MLTLLLLQKLKDLGLYDNTVGFRALGFGSLQVTSCPFSLLSLSLAFSRFSFVYPIPFCSLQILVMTADNGGEPRNRQTPHSYLSL